MKTFYARDYGVTPNGDVTKALNTALEAMRGDSEEKILVFDPGVYTVSSKNCKEHMLYITNTVGDNEFSETETPHKNAVPFYLKNVENLTIQGNGAIFLIDGKVTNIALVDCKNVTVENLEIRHTNPDMHSYTVLKKTLFTVDFKLDDTSKYRIENGKLYLYGTDYDYRADKNAVKWGWIGRIRNNEPNVLQRVLHPLSNSTNAREVSPHIIRFNFPNTFRFKKGDRFHVYDIRRQFAGIFLDRCENVTLRGIKQRFNYSLALVAQDCENVSVENVTFAPEEGKEVKLASCADFIQFCSCRGRLSVTDSFFDGAGDDCMNVHGIHFKIVKQNENELTVRFMHPQSHGFNPLRAGDEVAFINAHTLLENGRAKIIKSELQGEYDIRLTLDSVERNVVGEVIEDVCACPDVYFANNTLNRIITRGLLLTTRGKVEICNNHFISNFMSGILLSDDAKSWYESGMCCDVTVENNVFDFCGATPILIKPENSSHKGAVHKNVKILDNTFNKYCGNWLYAKSADNIQIRGNKLSGSKKIKTLNCTNVTAE